MSTKDGLATDAPKPAIDAKDEKAVKPQRTLNRVPRACNACRKQKMRCEGAENPPCKRCRHAGYECLFEKPVRDTTTSEQGLERIRNLENTVTSIQHTLTDLVTALRERQPLPSPKSAASPSSSGHPNNGPSPRFIAYAPAHESPPTVVSPHHQQPPPPQRSMSYPEPNVSAEREYHPYNDPGPYRRPSSEHRPPSHPPENGLHAHAMTYSHNYTMSSPAQHYNHHGASVGPTMQLPPFSTFQGMAPPPSPFSGPSHRPSSAHLPQPQSPSQHHGQALPLPPIPQGQPPRGNRYPQDIDPPYSESSHGPAGPSQYPDSSSARTQSHLQQPQPGPPQVHHGLLSHHHAHLRQPHTAVPSSNVTSVDSSEDEGEFPASGLSRPLPALQDLAALATQRVERGDASSAGRTRSPSPEASGSGRDQMQGGRATKRRKTAHSKHQPRDVKEHKYPDVVTKGRVSEAEARDLFRIFYHGCSTFLPIFDKDRDTFDALRARSPFCINAICMVAAKVTDAGGPEGPTYRICLEEMQKMACATLFSPVSQQEAIQATIIVAGWSSDGGWLSLGHAVRMAFEINMHKAWPRLLKKIRGRHLKGLPEDELQLVISTRTWFCLYLFEHQLSFSTGRPAILREDESVNHCREFLQHPLAIPDDTRLVSMVELAMIRERLHQKLSNTAAGSSSTPPDVYTILGEANDDFQNWIDYWDKEFANKHYQDAEYQQFQMQSLQVQRYFAELFHGASALRGIRGREDVPNLPPEQRRLALRCLEVAKKGLETCLNSAHYRDGLKYAVHYTHMSATFAASFLIRLARLFPDEVDLHMVGNIVESLARELSKIPATRYAMTLQIMLQKAHQRNVLPRRASENGAGPSRETAPNHGQGPVPHQQPQPPPHQFRSPSDQGQQLTSPNVPPGGVPAQPQLPQMVYPNEYPNEMLPQQFAQMVPHYELDPNGEVPVWLSESTLGDLNLAQYSLEAFIVPAEYGDHRALDRIW